ncbi:MAG: acyl carrier protein [Holophagaceae bacterium]|nr:acyl carrier protein [Holophagaceae bacterium]
MEALESNLRRFISDNFYVEPDELSAEVSLIGSGIVDSTGVLEIILHLEEIYGIKVEDAEALPRNLDSISNLVRFIESKLDIVKA